MSLTAAASGLVVFLLSVSAVQGQGGWGVTYSSTKICAVKGSTVEMSCSFTYPSTWRGPVNTLQKTFWLTEKKDDEYVDLTTVSKYAGRVEDLCGNKVCTLRIRNLTESDSAEYHFRIITNQDAHWGYPGTTLSVTDLQVAVSRSGSSTLLQCLSRCPSGQTSYIWFKNRQEVKEDTSSYANFRYGSADSYSCALKGYEDFRSPSVYAPKPPSVSVSPSAEIEEGSSVTLTCSSDANPAASYTWYKKEQKADLSFVKGPRLVLSSINSSDSGQYYCRAENLLGNTRSESISIDVTYAPKPPSVSVRPSAEIEEGSPVTLTCSSDANPAASYTWYKTDQNAHLSSVNEGPRLVFSSIQSSDSGQYYCTAENKLGVKTSNNISIDVTYAPKPPSVSVRPSAEIEEGSSVTLTCSSDANPAASYTWYKTDEDSPKASGQIFNISDFRAEHRGSYSCGAQNKLGRSNSTLHQIGVVTGGPWKLLPAAAAAVTIPVVLLAVISLSVFLWIRRKRASSEPEERADTREEPDQQDDPQYASVHFSNNRADPLYSNMRAAQPLGHTEQQEYAAVKFSSAAPRTRGQDSEEDPAALYSTVN